MSHRPPLTVHVSSDELLDLAYGLEAPAAASTAWSHIQSCELCEGRFRELVADRERGLSRWEERRREPVPLRRPRAWSSWRGWTAVAAALAVASLALWFQPGSDIDPVPLSAPGDALVLRSQDAASTNRLAAALEAYGRRDWDRALQLLSESQADPGRELVRRLYLGSASALAGRSAQAAETLEGMNLEHIPAPWRDEARWTLAAAYSDLGREEDARAVLELLARSGGAWADRAREALEQ